MKLPERQKGLLAPYFERAKQVNKSLREKSQYVAEDKQFIDLAILLLSFRDIMSKYYLAVKAADCSDYELEALENLKNSIVLTDVDGILYWMGILIELKEGGIDEQKS